MSGKKHIVVIGAGPAGLIAAECLARDGFLVSVFEQKPTPARKFLMAGRGGLNITHSENLDRFVARYGAAADWIGPMVRDFTPGMLRAWCADLGEDTFVGSSGRVFPQSFKASPLLRAWIARLDAMGVVFHMRHRWIGWDGTNALSFVRDDGGRVAVRAEAVLLSLGGASWPKLGSDAAWVPVLRGCGVDVASFQPANCGFFVDWSAHVADRFAGAPLKTITLTHRGEAASGDMVIVARPGETGVEGGVVYALSAAIRGDIAAHGYADVSVDFRPGLSLSDLTGKLSVPRGRASFSTWVRKTSGLPPAAIAVLRDCRGDVGNLSPRDLASVIKAAPLRLTRPFDMVRAISTSGGIMRDAVDDALMLRAVPGVFAAGEMLDWEAPTGGYLLQGCFATGVRAAQGIRGFVGNP